MLEDVCGCFSVGGGVDEGEYGVWSVEKGCERGRLGEGGVGRGIVVECGV